MALRIGVLIWIIPMYLMIMRIRMLIGSPVIRIMPLSDCTPIFSNFSCYFISAYISNFYLPRLPQKPLVLFLLRLPYAARS